MMVTKLSDKEINILESGDFEISLNIKKPMKPKKDLSSYADVDSTVIKKICAELEQANSREDGLSILERHLKNKKELDLFAKSIDLAVMRSDKIDTIKNNIVDVTVGARLRSEAIQGKKT